MNTKRCLFKMRFIGNNYLDASGSSLETRTLDFSMRRQQEGNTGKRLSCYKMTRALRLLIWSCSKQWGWIFFLKLYTEDFQYKKFIVSGAFSRVLIDDELQMLHKVVTPKEVKLAFFSMGG